jgi:hypothetical protein
MIQVFLAVTLFRLIGFGHFKGKLFLNCRSTKGEGTLFVQNIQNLSSSNSVASQQI